ncbi:hypothetical protein Pan216_50900 [Planctomycetes bacterium Pan216]|uniref:Amine oxidase domain-containing protein n=1 Tax=Kolteria novifilia TaxID=2527975 RepID=A0A518BB36_9BACT|nr:hypothetical protein Pan216_50900 [Planctomycetes bacterium Pan216]
MNEDFDTLIIGAGMSGLAAGIRLAYFGQRVLLVERHSIIGGLNSFYRLRGRDHDVGLHAVTNYVPKGTKGKPLTKLLRQLRISWDELDLCPQLVSSVAFPGRRLRFSNDFSLFHEEVAREFPHQADDFAKLVTLIRDHDELDLSQKATSARAVIGDVLSDPTLIDMLFCPLCYYGSALEHDMDWNQFVIMFKSIFFEGFARPRRGVRHIIKLLSQRFKKNGGILRTKCGVERLDVKDGRVASVTLDNGDVVNAERILSSAGLAETLRLCGKEPTGDDEQPGQISFMESISVLDRLPSDLGHDETITFFCSSDRFNYRVPEGLSDPTSGVICSPNNYAYDEPLDEGIMRVTTQARFDRWDAMEEPGYVAAKHACYEASLDEVVKFVPDFRPNVVDVDIFTPRTIKKFTGHDNGAVYGAPHKRLDGRTHLENLFLCGTDQGFLGIVGAVLSGISMANLHLLKS